MLGEHDDKGSLGSDHYCCNLLRYKYCIYVMSVFGAICQVSVAVYNIIHLALGHDFDSDEHTYIGIAFSVIAIVAIAGSALSEIGLALAVRKHFLCYIQWWMMFMMLLVITSLVMAVVSGFSLYHENNQEPSFWIGGSFLLIVIRVPIQMYFVDKFVDAEILHKDDLLHTYD